MDDKLSELRAERDLLESRVLVLERTIEQPRRPYLVAMPGEARTQAAESAASVDSLRARLAAVSTELAAMRGVSRRA